MTDLEWLATHLGWTELFYEKWDLWGVKPGESILHDGYSRFPRYDQSIDLMADLVEKMETQDQLKWLTVLQFDPGCYVASVNAPASLRLKAYRQVMEEANGPTQAPTQDGD